MSTARRIHAYLAAKSDQRLCDDCIKDGVGLSSRQQVHPITTAFGLTSDFDRRDGVCSACASEKLVTQMINNAGK